MYLKQFSIKYEKYNYVDAIATLSDWFRNLMSIFTRKASTFAPVQKGVRLATRLSDLGFTSWTATYRFDFKNAIRL